MSDVLEVAGLALLVAFASTFGLRWGLLAAAMVLVLLGLALDTARRENPTPGRRRRLRLPWRRSREQPYGVVRGDL